MRSPLLRPRVLSLMLLGLLCGGLLTFSLRAQSTPTPNPDFVDALWVSKLDKVLKLATSTGTVLFELPNAHTVMALAVDEARGIVWTYDVVNLTAYSFNGALLQQTAVPSPSPVVLLSDLSGVPGRLPLSTALHVDPALAQCGWAYRKPSIATLRRGNYRALSRWLISSVPYPRMPAARVPGSRHFRVSKPMIRPAWQCRP